MVSSARADDIRIAAPWTERGDTSANKVYRNFAPWAYSDKAVNASLPDPKDLPTLFKWEGPLEIVVLGAEAPKEVAEIRRWVEKLRAYYPGSISYSPHVTPRTNIVFALKTEKDGADLRPTLQFALSAKYAADIPLYPNWVVSAWCQTLWFTRDIEKVRPHPIIPSLWKSIERREHPIDFVFVAIQADFDNLEPSRFTQRTRDLLRTACIAEETLHALTGWQDIPD